MFRALPTGSLVEAAPNRIVSLQQSLNASAVAIGGPPVQARASVLGVYNPQGTYTVYILLVPSGGGASLVFCGDPKDIPLANFRKAESAALELVESQGFIMERVGIQNLAPNEKLVYLEGLPISGITPSSVYDRPLSGVYNAQHVDNFGSGSYSGHFNSAPSGSFSGHSSGSYSGGYAQGGNFAGDPSGGHYVPPPAGSMSHTASHASSSVFPPAPTGFQPAPSTMAPAVPRRGGRHHAGGGSQDSRHQTSPGTPINTMRTDLGMPPQEAIALLGRLLSVF